MILFIVLLINWSVGTLDTDSFGAPILLWPLSDKTFLSEVREGTPQNNSQCGIQFDTVLHTYLHCQPLQFDGQTRPYVDIHAALSFGQTKSIDDQTFFTFSFNADPVTSKGFLLHFRGAGIGNEQTEFSVWIEQNNTLCICYLTKEAIDVSACLPDVVRPGAWQFVSAGVALSDGHIEVAVDGPYTVKQDKRLVLTINMDLPGNMRIGSDHTDTFRFHGRVTCLSLYLGSVPISQMITILNRCFWGVSIWNVLPTGLPETPSIEGCKVETKRTERDAHFVKVATDRIPVGKETENITTNTVYRCVASCSRLSTCQSCVFVTPSTCLLYDVKYNAGNLKSMAKHIYYHRR